MIPTAERSRRLPWHICRAPHCPNPAPNAHYCNTHWEVVPDDLRARCYDAMQREDTMELASAYEAVNAELER